jgi:alkylhydroperoxidase/carboxymuconolactone decarboxylase family protein YurZ
MKELPPSYRQFQEGFSSVWEAFDNLGKRCHQAGPLEEKTRRLVKLGIAIGAGLEGAVHSYTRRALAEGITPEEIRHAVLMAMTMVGFPRTMAALTWVNDLLESA